MIIHVHCMILQNLSTAPTPQDEDEVIGEVEEDNEDHQGIINKGE